MHWTKNLTGKKSGNFLFWFGIIFVAPFICGIKHFFLLKFKKDYICLQKNKFLFFEIKKF